ncbi:MAG: DUF4249 domain-containing protein [Bacteroidales bacterium]
MRQIKWGFLLIFLIIFLQSCLEPYFPELPDDEVNTIVIFGGISDKGGYNYLQVSLATNISQPEYFPVTGCTGYVADESGKKWNIESTGEGNYRVYIAKENLVPGRKYKLYMKSPLGVEFESEEEMMPASSQLDSIYYKWETHQTSIPEVSPTGLQFYADMKGGPDDAKYYRWIVQESWEYHSPYPIDYYYDGSSKSIKRMFPPDYSKMICYSTVDMPKIFTMKTANLAENKYEGFSLHFIPNTDEKLLYAYSVMVKQVALSEKAYQYWEYLRQNVEDQSGLYQKQPLQIQGNIHALNAYDSTLVTPSSTSGDSASSRTYSSKRVLGFFTVSSEKEARITLNNIPDLEVDLSNYCRPWVPKSGGIGPYLKAVGWGKIIYMVGPDSLADESCFDCRLRGGTTVKPAFLP